MTVAGEGRAAKPAHHQEGTVVSCDVSQTVLPPVPTHQAKRDDCIGQILAPIFAQTVLTICPQLIFYSARLSIRGSSAAPYIDTGRLWQRTLHIHLELGTLVPLRLKPREPRWHSAAARPLLTVRATVARR
jgi:hypothetical protein